MPRMRSRLRSELSVSAEKTALLTKIAALYVQRPSRLKFEIGSVRFNATEATDVTFDPTQSHNQIQFQRPNSALTGGGKEQTDITCIADTGAKEITDITLLPDTAGSLNNKYFTFEDSSGAHKYYVWFNINSAGTDPMVATRTGIEVDGATGATANTLATAARAAISGSGANTYVAVTGATSHVIITQRKVGNAVNTADGAAPTGFTFTITPGAASNLNSKYFKIASAADATAYYVWYNVNGEGVDPTVSMRTGVEVDISAGATATAVAIATASALDALSDFVAAVPTTATLSVVNNVAGYSTDVADGTAATSFTFTKRGELEQYELTDIILIKRLRNKKWLIRLAESADAAHV